MSEYPKKLYLDQLYGRSLKSTTHLLPQKQQIWCQICQNSNSTSLISPSHVLSKSNKENSIRLLKSSKTPFSSKNKILKKAAVLVPLFEVNNHLAFLYTIRSFNLKVNGGEVAFPGGMFDDSDGSLEVTALREANEEVGIDPKEVDVWGAGQEIFRKDVSVTPVLGFLGQLNLEKLKLNTNEVSSVFSVTLEDLSNSQNFKFTTFRFNENYMFKTPVYLGGTKKIWGLTAIITHTVLSALIPEYYKKNIQFEPSTERRLRSKKKQ